MVKTYVQWMAVLALFLSGAVHAGELTEDQKRSEFAKAYAAAKPEERVAAVQILAGCKEDASFLWLVRVAKMDVEEAVRLSAYGLVAGWDDPVGKLEGVLLDIFTNEKNRDVRITMCQAFPNLKTKTMATDAAIKLLYSFGYPDMPDNNNDRNRDPLNNNNNNNNGGAGGGLAVGQRSKESVLAERKKFSDVLAVVNALTGQSFPASNRTRDAVRKWWSLHRTDFVKADAETYVKLRDEAKAAASKKEQ